jgi:hypothetical protein
MEGMIKAIDYSSMPVLKEQREALRRKFQVLRAMTGIKSGHKAAH